MYNEKIIPLKNINEELKNFIKPFAYSGLNLPLNSLEDRAFEVLLYQLFVEKITKDENDIKNKFDVVDLMQGVGEKGRDCLLSKNNNAVGIIQCKKVNRNISKPQFAKEILKFLLFSVIDKSLIPDITEFTYFFTVSTGLSGTTKELIRNFNEDIFKEEDLLKWVSEVLSEYKQFVGISYDSIKNELHEYLRKIKVERILPQDIELWLSNSPLILNHFFEVKSVTNNSLIEKIEKNYLIPICEALNITNENVVKGFNEDFKEYLSRSYVYYSSARTLVFGNQQKKLEDFYYPLELMRNNIVIGTKSYPENLLPKHRKVILVDSGGMGKSTVMKWLFTRAIKESKGIPIFIELRLLSERNTLLTEIVNQINPLDRSLGHDILLKLINRGNFIFFFDGYDEIKATEKAAVTRDISDFISKASKNEFIITSRPENLDGIFGDFVTFHIKQLSTKEAYDLIEKLGDYNERSKALISKLKQSDLRNIKEFLKNPLLISLLYKKFEYRESIPLQKQEFYFEVFEALFKAHDLTKGTDYYIRPKESNLSFSEFFRVLRLLAFRSVQDNELEYNQSVLLKLLEDLKEDLTNISYDGEALLNDLTMAVPLFQKEGLKFKWAHKSIQEYFAAEFICIDTKDDQKEILIAIFEGDRLANLLHVLELCYDIDPKSFRSSVIYKICDDFLQYSNSTFKDIIEKTSIPLQDIRDRQFRMYIEDTYLINCEQDLGSTKKAKKYFTKKIPKIKMSPRVSADKYYIGSIKKRENVRKILGLLGQKKNKLIKPIPFRDLLLDEQKEDRFRKSAISLFNGEITQEIISIDDKIDSPVNNPIFFTNVTSFMKGAYFDYEECIKIAELVKQEFERKKSGRTYTSGFGSVK